MVEEERYLYRKKETQIITAVKLDLVTTGFSFYKWGHTQHCNAGDWLVNSNDDCYTVDCNIFEKSYKEISPGRFIKHGLVRAKQARAAGQVSTLEGITEYKKGDFIVESADDPTDTYAMDAQKFYQLYERAENKDS